MYCDKDFIQHFNKHAIMLIFGKNSNLACMILLNYIIPIAHPYQQPRHNIFLSFQQTVCIKADMVELLRQNIKNPQNFQYP